ncbi:hypothetical protein QE392_000765 [Microbacterium proteolyticum]|nr:hypothetical protein [Microbacterium proteolyticum]
MDEPCSTWKAGSGLELRDEVGRLHVVEHVDVTGAQRVGARGGVGEVAQRDVLHRGRLAPVVVARGERDVVALHALGDGERAGADGGVGQVGDAVGVEHDADGAGHVVQPRVAGRGQDDTGLGGRDDLDVVEEGHLALVDGPVRLDPLERELHVVGGELGAAREGDTFLKGEVVGEAVVADRPRGRELRGELAVLVDRDEGLVDVVEQHLRDGRARGGGEVEVDRFAGQSDGRDGVVGGTFGGCGAARARGERERERSRTESGGAGAAGEKSHGLLLGRGVNGRQNRFTGLTSNRTIG